MHDDQDFSPPPPRSWVVRATVGWVAVLLLTSCGVHLERGAVQVPGLRPYPTHPAVPEITSALQQARIWERQAIAVHSPAVRELTSHVTTLTARLREFGQEPPPVEPAPPAPSAVTVEDVQRPGRAPLSDRAVLITVQAARLVIAPQLHITVPPASPTRLYGLAESVRLSAAATRYTWEVARARKHDIAAAATPCEAGLSLVEDAIPAEERLRSPWSFPVTPPHAGAPALRNQIHHRAFAVEAALLAEALRRTSPPDVVPLTFALAAMERCRRAWGGPPHALPGIG